MSKKINPKAQSESKAQASGWANSEIHSEYHKKRYSQADLDEHARAACKSLTNLQHEVEKAANDAEACQNCVEQLRDELAAEIVELNYRRAKANDLARELIRQTKLRTGLRG